MNLLVPIILGSEVRQFIWSGLVSKLIDNGVKVYVAVRPVDNDLPNEIKHFDDRILFCEYHDVNIKRSFLSYLQLILDYNYDSTNSRWSYTAQKEFQGIKSIFIRNVNKIIKNHLVSKVLFKLEKKLLKKYNTNGWNDVIRNCEINCILVNVPRLAQQLNSAAIKFNIPVVLFFHTNKDIVAMHRPNFKYSLYGVWNDQMKLDLMTKIPDVQEDSVLIIGNLHLFSLKQEIDSQSEVGFKDLFGISRNQKLILYTAASPISVINEQSYVIDIIQTLNRLKINDFVIVVRKNPMDDTDSWETIFKNYDNVKIQKPQWYWNKKFNFNYAHKADSAEYSFLLKNAKICINIPSSVSLEAALFGLPVVNICYDNDLVKFKNVKSIVEFWKADFYQVYHGMDFILPCYNSIDMSNLLSLFCYSENIFFDYNMCVSLLNGVECNLSFNSVLNHFI